MYTAGTATGPILLPGRVRRTGVGEHTVLLASWRRRLKTSNLSPGPTRAYIDDGAPRPAGGKPTAGASMRRERIETSIAAELETTAVIRERDTAVHDRG